MGWLKGMSITLSLIGAINNPVAPAFHVARTISHDTPSAYVQMVDLNKPKIEDGYKQFKKEQEEKYEREMTEESIKQEKGASPPDKEGQNPSFLNSKGEESSTGTLEECNNIESTEQTDSAITETNSKNTLNECNNIQNVDHPITEQSETGTKEQSETISQGNNLEMM